MSDTKLASRSRSAWSGPAIADSPSRSLRLREMRVRIGDQSDPAQHLGSSRRGTAAFSVDVQQHALGLRQRNVSIEARQSMVEMEILLIAAKHQRRHLHHLLGPDLVQERDVRFRREVRATASQIIAINPDIPDEGVGGIGHHLDVAALRHVAVVVDPVRRNPRPVQPQREREVIALIHDRGVGGVEQGALVRS